jgi:hypothetical protein
MKTKIVTTHIENDLRNGQPTVVITDENGIEWVHEEQTTGHGFLTALVKKSDSWYFRTEPQGDTTA